MTGSIQRVGRSWQATAQAGFTLLELMIVISVIIILAAITLPQYQKTIMHTREAVLARRPLQNALAHRSVRG